MQKIEITKTVKPRLLAEQLFSAFPGWFYTNWRNRKATDVSVTRKYVLFPDGTDPIAVQAVIDAHDPNGQSNNDIDEQSSVEEKDEFDSRPDWLKHINYNQLEDFIRSNTVGTVTEAQALAIVDVAANLNDIKAILRNLVKAVYGLVNINIRIARIVLVVVRFIARRM